MRRGDAASPIRGPPSTPRYPDQPINPPPPRHTPPRRPGAGARRRRGSRTVRVTQHLRPRGAQLAAGGRQHAAIGPRRRRWRWRTSGRRRRSQPGDASSTRRSLSLAHATPRATPAGRSGTRAECVRSLLRGHRAAVHRGHLPAPSSRPISAASPPAALSTQHRHARPGAWISGNSTARRVPAGGGSGRPPRPNKPCVSRSPELPGDRVSPPGTAQRECESSAAGGQFDRRCVPARTRHQLRRRGRPIRAAGSAATSPHGPLATSRVGHVAPIQGVASSRFDLAARSGHLRTNRRKPLPRPGRRVTPIRPTGGGDGRRWSGPLHPLLGYCFTGRSDSRCGPPAELGATAGEVLRHANSFETLAGVAPQRPVDAVGMPRWWWVRSLSDNAVLTAATDRLARVAPAHRDAGAVDAGFATSRRRAHAPPPGAAPRLRALRKEEDRRRIGTGLKVRLIDAHRRSGSGTRRGTAFVKGHCARPRCRAL